MGVKLLISGTSNSGKTTLTKSLKDALVISFDGKSYPFAIPHIMVKDIDTIEAFTALIDQKIIAYKDKFGAYPKIIVFDSISKIFETLLNVCNEKYKGFVIYTELNKEIALLMDYIQNKLIASDMTVVIISHAIYDADTTKYNLVGTGAFAKRGGVLAETDEAIFIETKANKRIAHFRSVKYPARTLSSTGADSMDVNDFDLQKHIDMLKAAQTNADEYAM